MTIASRRDIVPVLNEAITAHAHRLNIEALASMTTKRWSRLILTLPQSGKKITITSMHTSTNDCTPDCRRDGCENTLISRLSDGNLIIRDVLLAKNYKRCFPDIYNCRSEDCTKHNDAELNLKICIAAKEQADTHNAQYKGKDKGQELFNSYFGKFGIEKFPFTPNE